MLPPAELVAPIWSLPISAGSNSAARHPTRRRPSAKSAWGCLGRHPGSRKPWSRKSAVRNRTSSSFDGSATRAPSGPRAPPNSYLCLRACGRLTPRSARAGMPCHHHRRNNHPLTGAAARVVAGRRADEQFIARAAGSATDDQASGITRAQTSSNSRMSSGIGQVTGPLAGHVAVVRRSGNASGRFRFPYSAADERRAQPFRWDRCHVPGSVPPERPDALPPHGHERSA